MRKSCFAIASELLALGAISLPLLASSSSVVAASQRTTPPIGTQLAELKGPDNVDHYGIGLSVAISGKTVVVLAFQAAYVFQA